MKPVRRLVRATSMGAPAVREATLELAEIGVRGDATARLDGEAIYAPFGLPGEEVRARIVGERAELIEILKPSSDRRAPVCAHFGACGGCQLQHWADAPYLAWKRDVVIRALARRGLEVEVDPIVEAWGEGRRRVALHAERASGRAVLGFVERGGARIAPIDDCPVLTARLRRALPTVRATAELLAPMRGELTLACLDSETGVDVNVKGAARAAVHDRALLEEAVALAEAGDLARLSLDGEPIVVRRAPRLAMGAAMLAPPPGAFVQATRAGEQILAALVVEALAGAARVADLFSGCGTFALRTAAFAETHAFEGDADMLEALKRAADGAGGALKSVAVVRRDLLRTPVSALELKRFDAAVLDPPRSGARLQAEQLAASKVARVASVSCDPATFARDARILVDAGFRPVRVAPIDQFRFSPHVEIVGAFKR
jgi:23S rRNA (uracil1939-C5)-methyltransferase